MIPRRKAPRAQPPVVAPHAPAAVPPSLLPSVAPEFQFGVPEPTQLEEENVDMDDQVCSVLLDLLKTTFIDHDDPP